MSPQPLEIDILGQAGLIDIAVDYPLTGPPYRGAALVAHPHPLMGGTREHKVVRTLSRALQNHGFVVWRPNFRGVGRSEGTFDAGEGETLDLLHVLNEISAGRAGADPQQTLVLAGFSFGAAVQAKVANALAEQGTLVQKLILVGTAVSRFQVPEVPPSTLLIHGENDEVIPLSSLMDWARPQGLAVTVLPESGHFFHRKLVQLKQVTADSVAALLYSLHPKTDGPTGD